MRDVVFQFAYALGVLIAWGWAGLGSPARADHIGLEMLYRPDSPAPAADLSPPDRLWAQSTLAGVFCQAVDDGAPPRMLAPAAMPEQPRQLLLAAQSRSPSQQTTGGHGAGSGTTNTPGDLLRRPAVPRARATGRLLLSDMIPPPTPFLAVPFHPPRAEA